jgi:hypothetical protein
MGLVLVELLVELSDELVDVELSETELDAFFAIALALKELQSQDEGLGMRRNESAWTGLKASTAA